MQHTVIEYATLSWAVIGVSEQPPGFSLASLQRENETFEDTVERYVILYMAFWNITYAKDCRPQEPMSQEKAVKGKQKIEQYIKEHPP